MIRTFQTLLFLVIAIPTSGCRTSDDAPDELILYSLDGRDRDDQPIPIGNEQLHSYPVLGKIAIRDAATRASILKSLNDGIAASDGHMAACFWPRHAIRTIQGGQTIDYIICFECSQVAMIQGDSRVVKPITQSAESEYDQILSAAKIPLAPK